MIKVLLVDDEAMVIEDTLQMLDWEANGFAVVGALTSSVAAWEVYLRERPQIIIADICMPVMDGLALSERILSTGDVVQVLLLSSHENFRYAKSAIALGVSRYLLKHELDSDVLQRELRLAVNQLEEDWQTRQLQKQQQLRRMLAGEESAEADKMLRRHTHWLLAFSALPAPGSPPLTDHSLRGSIGQEGIGTQGVAVALAEGSLAVLLPLPIGPDGRAETSGAALQCVSSFQQTRGLQGRALFYEIVHGTSACFGQQYALWRQLSRYAIFLNDGPAAASYRLGELAEQCAEVPVEQRRFRSLLDGLERAIDELAQETASQKLDALFALCRQPPWNYNNVTWLATNLDGLCAQLSRQIGYVPASVPADGLGGVRWKSLGDMHDYYSQSLQDLLEQKLSMASSRYSRNLALAIQYILSNYSEDISLDRVAAVTGISGVYLSQLFKRETGQTFVEFLTAHRVEAAKKLLREGNYKIYKVSEMVGFRSNQYFSQVFRKITNLSPLDYRDSNR